MRNKVEQLLKNLPAYRYAVRQYEKYRPQPSAGIANYSGMPNGSGPPELFFAQVGKMADMGELSREDHEDYKAYKMAVEAVEGALETLDDEEKSIIKKKWMDNLTLNQIADIKGVSYSTVKKKHKSALGKLRVCFRFTEPPQIEDIPRTAHNRFNHNNRIQSYMDIT